MGCSGPRHVNDRYVAKLRLLEESMNKSSLLSVPFFFWSYSVGLIGEQMMMKATWM